MIDYREFYKYISATALSPWCDSLPPVIEKRFDEQTHGHVQEWTQLLQNLPDIHTDDTDFKNATIRIGRSDECDEQTRTALAKSLAAIMPWRKGPFDLFGIHIDTEWRSDLKWDRLSDHIQPLQGRRVLDVGCGSGYHCLRMYGEGAELVVGIEPLLRYITQFYALLSFIKPLPVYLLPLTLEGLPQRLPVFDTVFSMGVLYHRKSPFEHLNELKDCLQPGGELVLETLVVKGDSQTVLTPENRYAKMRNVWFIPSVEAATIWLQRAGFNNIKLIDESVTTTSEQRSTNWMTFESLTDFLDPQDSSLTVEGYPAPRRAIFSATKPR